MRVAARLARDRLVVSGLGAALVIASWSGSRATRPADERLSAAAAGDACPPSVRHPIYVGFAGLPRLVTGVSLGERPLLVTPTVALASAALVLGYEGPDLRRRFGTQTGHLNEPRSDCGRAGPPGTAHRRLELVVLPWCVLYRWSPSWAPADAISAYLPFERRLGGRGGSCSTRAPPRRPRGSAPRATTARSARSSSARSGPWRSSSRFTSFASAGRAARVRTARFGTLLAWGAPSTRRLGRASFHVVWAPVADLIAPSARGLLGPPGLGLGRRRELPATGMHALIDVVPASRRWRWSTAARPSGTPSGARPSG